MADTEPVAGKRTTKGLEAEGEPEASIATQLAELRKEHGYSIRKLAGEANVSASLISDVERGKVEPSISTLKRLADALDTRLTYFFSAPGRRSARVVRAAGRVVLAAADTVNPEVRAAREPGGVRFELASPEEARDIEAIFAQYEVGASVGREPLVHGGEEWGMVLRGRLKIWVGEEIHFLDPGDSIWYPSTMPHRMENVADEPTEYVWVDTPERPR